MMKNTNRIKKYQIDINDIMMINQNAIFSRINCHNIGRIIDFNSETQTCTVELMQLKQFGESTYIPPTLTDVPLVIYGCKDATITLPNPTGTICILLFMDRNIDNFLVSGEQYIPENDRMHDYNDCVALCTFNTLVNPIENYDEESISINYRKIIDEVLYNAVIKNSGNSITLAVNTEENNAQIQITDKINIQNTTQNLALLVQNLLTACENITTVNGGALTPTSIQAFTDLKTQFEELLQ